MFKPIIKFIHDLRIFFFALILISSLYAIGLDPVDVGKFIGARMSLAIGVSTSTSVPSNPFNTLAMQLDDKEKRLNEREDQLNQKERDQNIGGIISQRSLIYILISGILILFVLISMNFYFDHKRRKAEEKN